MLNLLFNQLINAILYPKGYNMLPQYVKQKRKENNITQEELSFSAGVGLRFIRDLEQGKKTLRIDKVNQVLKVFGSELIPCDRRKNK